MEPSGRRRKIIVQPHLGDVQHDSDVRRIGQDVLVGQNDLPAGRGPPPVDSAICVRNFLGRHPEPSPDVEQRVALLDLVRNEIADDVVLAVRKRIGIERATLEFVFAPRAIRSRGRDQRDQEQGGEDSNRDINEALHELRGKVERKSARTIQIAAYSGTGVVAFNGMIAARSVHKQPQVCELQHQQLDSAALEINPRLGAIAAPLAPANDSASEGRMGHARAD